MKRLLCFFITIIWCAGYNTLSAQSISAQVSGKRIQVGVPFEFAVVISGNSSNYNQPQFRDFDIVSGPNQSSSIQYVNGNVSQQIIFSYGLVARKEGKFVIPSANALVNGQRMETQPITIEVVKNSSGGAANQNENQQDSRKQSGNDIFIKTTISKGKCYVGEQVLIVQKVYSRHQIVGYQKSVQPSYDGFYSQQQESPTKGQLIMENVDGVNYFTHEVMRTLATANKSGKIQLSPMEADVVVRKQTSTRARNIFEQFFGAAGYEDVPVHAVSRPATIDVLPLPEVGKPESFDGAVGSFNQKVELSRTELKANEALNLKITISGKGNLKLINAPKLQLPESFESYEPKTAEGQSFKSFEYLVIPREEGVFELKDFEFSYFNLESKKYSVIASPVFSVKVLESAAGQGAQVFTPHSNIKETENDIRYIKKGDFVLNKSDKEFFHSTWHLALMAFVLLGLGTALFIRHNYVRNNSDMVQVRERKAAAMAGKRLLNAEKMMKLGKKDEFYTEVLLAMNSYLSDKLNIPVSNLSKEKVKEVMVARMVDATVMDQLINALSTSEYAKYAPGAVSGDLNAVYSDTVKLITNIESQLAKKTA